MVTTTAIYAGILALISIVLANRAGVMRGRLGIPVGDGGNSDLSLAMRRHANFVEYVPFVVVMMAMIELNGAPKWWLHALGVALVAARIVHPFGIASVSNPLRIAGAATTALVTVVSAAILLWQGIAAL